MPPCAKCVRMPVFIISTSNNEEWACIVCVVVIHDDGLACIQGTTSRSCDSKESCTRRKKKHGLFSLYSMKCVFFEVLIQNWKSPLPRAHIDSVSRFVFSFISFVVVIHLWICCHPLYFLWKAHKLSYHSIWVSRSISSLPLGFSEFHRKGCNDATSLCWNGMVV